MKITELCLENFRNIEACTVEPCDRINVIYGNNAQGKTSLLEAIYLCTGLRSFKGAKESEFIKFGKNSFKVSSEFRSENRTRRLEYSFSEQSRRITLSGVEKKSPSELCEEFRCVAFSPENLSLIKGSPEKRRRFVDTALCQLRPSYKKLVLTYKRVIDQRNALLREYSKRSGISYLSDMLDAFDARAAALGSRICAQRQKYIENILPFACEFFSGLSDGSENLEIVYTGSEYATNDGEDRLLCAFSKSRDEDCRLLSTGQGPHRHDIKISVNGISAKEFGSQGQQRSAAISLKLSEAELLAKYTGEQPIVLLDDVMSELDTVRQNYILNRLDGRQVFITCCDPAPVTALCGGRVFYAKSGRIEQKHE